jgi:acetolactate decarboxylase
MTNVKKLLLPLLAPVLFITLAAGCTPAIRGDRDTMYQVSTTSALAQGVFDGDVTVRQLRDYGDIGAGVFHALDGEMIMLDGHCYRVRLDGTIEPAADDAKIAFGEATFFDRDAVYAIDKELDLNGLTSYLDGVLPTKNLFYAIKVEGKFSDVTTRSVPLQQKPYRLLSEVVKESQQLLEQKDVEGTIVGFRCPSYTEGVCITGYHLHFINKDRTRGGHVLEIKTASVKAIVDGAASMILHLPGADNSEFIKASLGGGAPEGLKQVEQGK